MFSLEISIFKLIFGKFLENYFIHPLLHGSTQWLYGYLGLPPSLIYKYICVCREWLHVFQ